MSATQLAFLHHLLRDLKIEEFHHGLCVGSDHQAHRMARALQVPIYGHPPKNQKAMMEFDPSEFAHLYPPDDYLPRDRSIVDHTALLLGAPFDDTVEVIRSGTWYTIRYARKQRTPHLVIQR